MECDVEPIVCTLAPTALRQRGDDWGALSAEGLVSWKPRPDGVTLWFRPAFETRVRDLLALEAECCRWFSATVTGGDPLTVDLVAEGTGPDVLRAMFGGHSPAGETQHSTG